MSGQESETSGETRVLYNADCPICSREIDHYRGRAERDALPLRFDALQGPDLAAWGVDADAAARRLHVRHEGRVVAGMEAFRVLWRQMPHMTWLARVTGAPGLRQGTDWVYEWVLAPLLYRMHLRRITRGGALMFTIEHEFDATVVTLVDEPEPGTPPGEDVTVSAFEECITLTQADARSGEPVQVTLTMAQVRDLLVALDLPEGVYRRNA